MVASIGRYTADEVKRGEVEGLVPATEMQALMVMKELFQTWEPWQQAAPITAGSFLASIAAAIPGPMFSRSFWRLYPVLRDSKLRWMTIALPCLVPGSFAGMSHEFFLVNDILVQKTPCSVCLETRAVSSQLALGLFLPFAAAVGGTIVVGLQHDYRWAPDTLRQTGQFTRRLWQRSAGRLAGVAAVQLVGMAALVAAELYSYDSVMTELGERVARDKAGLQDPRVLSLEGEVVQTGKRTDVLAKIVDWWHG